MIAQLLFSSALLTAVYFASKSIARIRRNIKLGKDISMDDNKSERFKKMALIALGQKKMFDKPIPAFLHLIIYIGFFIVNLEMLEIVMDGLLGTHRLFLPILGSAYPLFISIFEFFAIGVIAVCIVFLFRRNALKLKRFQSPELKKWPFLDANLILVFEIVLMWAFLNMNAIDQLLQSREVLHYRPTGDFLFSRYLVGIYSNASNHGLVVAERFYWWVHILGVFVFANYLPYSKHLHILLAFPNTYYSRLSSAGKINNMPVVTNEVKSMLGIPNDSPFETDTNNLTFGAKDIKDLTWKNLLDAYTCTECGRCTAVCPANITGKLLSPRKIMMDTRDRMEEIGNLIDKKQDWENTEPLYSEKYISKEELLACTTCNACVDACPVNISPLEIIVELRRNMVMEESKAPASWNAMFSNLETNFSPWKFSTSDRFNWSDKL